MSFFAELKRRNVLRMAAAYVVAAWLVIQVVETILPAFGFSDVAVRIVVILLSIGLVPVLILAWAFELTPEGLKLDKDVDRSQYIAARTGKKLDRIIMVVLALALGYFSFDKFVLTPQRQAAQQQQQVEEVATARQEGRSEALVESYGDKSIAVMPFVNLSDDVSNEFFSDGISEELLNQLAKIPELRVISRSSAFSFKGKHIDTPTIAQRLNVTHLLEGSVRKSGNQVRITAQLIEARSDRHLWSRSWDRTIDDIFAIQDEIAAEVLEQLKITLLAAAPTVEETDPQAYALYLQAHHLKNQGTPKAWEQSIGLLKQALEIDPDYATGWAELARVYNGHSFGLLPWEEAFRLTREAANKALEIDPNNALAHVSLGFVALNYDKDIAATIRYFERALALEPANPTIISSAAVLVSSWGRLDEAIALREFLVVRDPVNSVRHHNLCVSYLFARRPDAAIASCRTALMLGPGKFWAQYIIGVALLFKGEPEAALAAFAQEGDEDRSFKGTVLALHDLGRHSEFETAFNELRDRWGKQQPTMIAEVYAWTGDSDAAFAWLDRAVAQNEGGLNYHFRFPLYTPLHTDPRWAAFRERTGSSEAQLAAFELKVTLPE